MAYITPICDRKEPFDASTSQVFKFQSVGGDRVESNKLTIYDEDNEVVYENWETTYAFSQTLPADTLENGNTYYYTFTTGNVLHTSTSSESTKTLFVCIETPTFSISNYLENIPSTVYPFDFNYASGNEDALAYFVASVYNEQKARLRQSEYIYAQTGVSTYTYNFGGFDNHTSYYVELAGQTVGGLSFTTGLLPFYVNVSGGGASFQQLELANKCHDGYIEITSNVTAIEGLPREGFSVEYDDGKVNLYDLNNYVEWKRGLVIPQNFLLKLWGNVGSLGDILSCSNKNDDLFKLGLRRNKSHAGESGVVTKEGKKVTFTDTSAGDNIYVNKLYGKSYQDEIVPSENLLDLTITDSTRTFNGLTIVNNGDNTYTINGTCTLTGFLWIQTSANWFDKFIGKTVRLTGFPYTGVTTDMANWNCNFWGSPLGIEDHNFTFVAHNNYNLAINFKQGGVWNNVVIKPMITENLDATYDDYTPAGGASGEPIVSVGDSGTITLIEKVDDALEPTKTVPFNIDAPLRSIGDVRDYIDVSANKIVRNIGHIASYNGETITTEWLSTLDNYEAGTSPSTGAEVIYILDTPTRTTMTDAQANAFNSLIVCDGQTIVTTGETLDCVLNVSVGGNNSEVDYCILESINDFLIRSNYATRRLNNNCEIMITVKHSGDTWDIALDELDASYHEVNYFEQDTTFTDGLKFNSNIELNRLTDYDVYYMLDEENSVALQNGIDTHTYHTSDINEIFPLTEMRLMNGEYDALYITRNTYDATIVPSLIEWDYNTVFNAQFDDNLVGGNLSKALESYKALRVKRRARGEFDWVAIKDVDLTVAEDASFVLHDAITPSNVEFEYALVPITNDGQESDYIVSTVKSIHDGLFVTCGDITFKLYCGVTMSNTNVTARGQFQPIGSRYSTIVRNSAVNYITGQVAGVLYGYDFENKHYIDRFSVSKQVNDFKNMLASGVPITITDWNGNIYLANVIGQEAFNFDMSTGACQVSFNFAECGQWNNQQDLYENGYTNVP